MIAAEAFEAQRNHLTGRWVHVADDVANALEDEIHSLMATERALRECIAEDLVHRRSWFN